jgi:glutamate racemase
MNNIRNQHIGVFDSGFGGLTILHEIQKVLPEYSYIYLGDNARSPYGTRSFETVYKYTLEAVKKLFELDCSLIIIACNTASAKALRTIQQNDLPKLAPNKRILGIIRPCTEQAGSFTANNNLGILLLTELLVRIHMKLKFKNFFLTLQLHLMLVLCGFH